MDTDTGLSEHHPLLLKGQEAYSKGDLHSAERHLRSLLRSSPDDLDSKVLLGIVCARQGRREEAISLLDHALQSAPDCFEAHVAISTLLFADRQPERAKTHGERAIALQPEDAEAAHHLARDLIAHGFTMEAIPYLRRAFQLGPSNPRIVIDLATALTEVGQLGESMELWGHLTRSNPQLIIGWIKLGGMYLAARKFSEAVACGQRAVALQPNLADARIVLGLACLGNQDSEGAIRHLGRAIKLNPKEVAAQSAYGLALHELGRFDDARPYFEAALEIRPSNGQAYYSLIRTRKTSEQDKALLDKLIGHLDDADATVLDRSYMQYALGKAREDLGEYEASMQSYDEATDLATKAWFSRNTPNRDRYSRTIQATMETFTPELLSSSKRRRLSSEKPLLVVGMIRSGTTLVEQILSSHPEIKGAGELTYWHDVAAQIFDPQKFTVDNEGWEEAGEKYLQLLDRLGPDHRRVIDKLPHNYAMLGFALGVIPNARVVYVKRSPIDNCLSIYTTPYQHPPAFTLDRSDIVFSYREHERIMAYWKLVLPADRLLEVSYEELVENREEVTRRMIEFTGLAWSDSCLYPERNERTVNTPSVWQVRQPIYKSSVERWRKFEPWLGEFRELMDNAPIN